MVTKFLKLNKGSIKIAGDIIKKQGIGVLPTDTIYGIVAQAISPKAVNKVYKLRKRNPKKPFIILIPKTSDLSKFAIKVDKFAESILHKAWPGKVSIILPCPSKRLYFLHRGTYSLAFRLPKDKNLLNLLKRTGPLTAPSANLEGKRPAATAKEAFEYFGNKIDFYMDGGKRKPLASTIIRIQGKKILHIRKGAVSLKGLK